MFFFEVCYSSGCSEYITYTRRDKTNWSNIASNQNKKRNPFGAVSSPVLSMQPFLHSHSYIVSRLPFVRLTRLRRYLIFSSHMDFYTTVCCQSCRAPALCHNCILNIFGNLMDWLLEACLYFSWKWASYPRSIGWC